MPGSGQELSSLVLEEIENDEKLQHKLGDPTTTEKEREAINFATSELKKLIISEEKLTRILFGNILTWFQEERKREAAKDPAEGPGGMSTLTAEDLRQFSGG